MIAGKPDWVQRAMQRLEQFERNENATGAKALIFVTNIAHHRELDKTPTVCGAAFGLGMPDFNRPRSVRVTDAYRAKKKYTDAHEIGRSFERYLHLMALFHRKHSTAASRGT